MRFSLEGKLALLGFLLVAAVAALVAFLSRWLGSPWLAFLVGVAVATPLATIAARYYMKPVSNTLRAVGDGIASLTDRDFSVSIGATKQPELTSLVEGYNRLGNVLREERQSLYQRELLLDTVIQATPLAMVLTNANGRVVYSNVAARQTFLGGRKLEGLAFAELIAASPEPLRLAVASEADSLFTIEGPDESEIYHLSQRGFLLNSQLHRLYLLKQMTRELARQEVETWKKVIRVIAHELNNSLAPISSLAHSGQLLAHQPDAAQLERVFKTIGDRVAHLTSFIEGYAKFAKLPRPRLAAVPWQSFISRLQDTMGFNVVGPVPPTSGNFDASQMEQVMINLLKNAAESGSAPEDIGVRVHELADGVIVEVTDRGTGLAEEVLRDALLPFYSTKATGTGLGLTLCREIVEAHGGRLSLANHAEGGAVVTVWLPRVPG